MTIKTWMGAASLLVSLGVHAQSGVLVYQQDFETPNASAGTSCIKFGNVAAGLSSNSDTNAAGSFAADYNGQGGATFQQVGTADRLCWDNPAAPAATRITDASLKGGKYSGGFGRNNSGNIEAWGAAFDAQGHTFLNGSMDLSILTPGSVNLALGQDSPEQFQLNFYKIPSNSFTLSSGAPAVPVVPGGSATLLGTTTIQVNKASGTSRFAAEWQAASFSIDVGALQPTDRVLLVATAMTVNSYFAFDNLRLTAAPTAVPEVSIQCDPNSLPDSEGQQSTCTITANQPVTYALDVGLNLPVNSRYTSTCQPVMQIPAGQSSVQCTVNAVANVIPNDGNVPAVLQLQADPQTPARYSLGAGSSATVTIMDDDPVPVLNVQCTPSTLNDAPNQQAACTISAAGPVASAVPVSVDLPPNPRYTSTCVSPLVIPVGQSSVQCTIDAVANVIPNDGNVPAVLQLQADPQTPARYSLGAGSSATVTIMDDDPVSVLNVQCTPSTLNDAPNQQAACTISAAGPVASAVPVSVDLPPNPRYTSTCVSPLVIPMGQSSVQCTIDAVANTAAGDGDVTATLRLQDNPTQYALGVNSSASVLVRDDDLRTPEAVPSLGLWGWLGLSVLAPIVAWRTRRRTQA